MRKTLHTKFYKYPESSEIFLQMFRNFTLVPVKILASRLPFRHDGLVTKVKEEKKA